MQVVTVIGFDGALASAITGVIDLFRLAGVTWARIHGESPTPYFQTRLLTRDGEPCRCINGLRLVADGAWQDLDPGTLDDLVIVPTIGAPIDQVLRNNPDLITWLSAFVQADSGQVRVASNCTGAFLLAEAGLLDGRQATTHWGFSNQFRQRFPEVSLHPEQMVTVDGFVACSGGGVAWWDLGVYLVERFVGAEVARELAKAFVIDVGRNSQAPYSVLQTKRYHTDASILRLQDWLDQHYRDPVTLAALAEQAGLTERSLLRRFKLATGDSPTAYLQLLRVEEARRRLESSGASLETITREVGYEDVSSFSRLFRKHTGLAPGAYRARFS
ncbi:GlxA family transcriptional regulator [Marinobacter zhejiangensis]|uniref:Transcriptional regulator, AraC family with amidase-like domain n=1 Tax=Marinobacter zhejiangensis TaxID=488535 RepID=A0A1I4Q3U7_9GAMM|nr:helix-turn-helix domain-containing protein [Marinobacter zhejiangensis]SFM34293.1 transcriptional regulator, AraC family with amidase-like domain [Marinobacter zhejiangensis]